MNLSLIKLGQHEWSVPEDMLLGMKKSPRFRGFLSPIFKLGPFQWILEIFPNDEIKTDEGYFSAYFNLISLPPELYKMYMQISLGLKETQTQYQLHQMLNHELTGEGWSNGILLTKDIVDLNTMTFTLNCAATLL